jgi:methionyl-tRNA synthetase
MKEKILITSALPYANGPLHFGHIAGAYLPGDCYARFQRLQGNDVLYICGSDEYGVAITLSADLAKRTPQQHVDLFHEVNKNFFKKLNFSFDHYSRTTWPGHIPTVHQYFLDLLKNGFIESRITDQLYSEADQKFLADRYVVGQCPRCGFQNARGDECPECGASYDATDLINPRSKLTNSPLVHKPTKHWFLLLEKFKEQLTEWIDSKKWKPNVVHFVKGYINELHARSITRDSTWGVSVPLPDTEGKILYVWFDAPIGYISATKQWAQEIGNPDRWKEYWLDQKTKLVNFIGKDNIPFHAAIFPAMTMGQNEPYKLVDELPANEFYKLEGRQFSKSDGWYIDLEDFLNRYTVDQIRYTIAANAPETADSEFTWKDFQMRCNAELLGKYGNLVNRVLVFAHNKCGGAMPAQVNLQAVDKEFMEKIRALVHQAEENYRSFKLRSVSQTIMELAHLGNAYFDHKKPWADAKQPETLPAMNATIACCLECLKALALISSPIIPETANRVWHMLGYPNNLQDMSWSKIMQTHVPAGQKLKEPVILFKKIEDDQIMQEIEKLHAMANKTSAVAPKQAVEVPPIKQAVDIEDVKKLDLRVGIVLEAITVPKSKKLLKLLVDIGVEKRTIVAGISQHYQPEQLIGKRIVIVANLKPAILMGIQSQGMVLAAGLDNTLELPHIQNLPAGSPVS